MENLWRITLSDGTQLINLKLNGNNFVSEEEITEEFFDGKLSKVTFEGIVEGKQLKYVCKQMQLVQLVQYEDGYYFILRELSQDELDKKEIQDVLEILLAGEEF